MSTDKLAVFSFNCWGLQFVAKHRRFRIEEIAKFISTQDYDIITLQEVWVWSDFEYIKEAVQHKLPYFKYFYSGALGSGLVILSRLPIIASSFHRFGLNGRPLMILHGDYYVGKGVGSALIDHPTLGLLEVFNTHLHAGYGPKDRYKAHRATECWQLSNILRASAAMGRHIIMSGDFNSMPDTFNYHLIRDHGFMTDSWLQLHGIPDPQQFNMDQLTPSSYTQYFGYTCNSPFNSFSRYYDNGSNKNALELLGKRLDYIFYRYSPQLRCVASKVVLDEMIPDSGMSYSDHFGVVSYFNIDSTISSDPKDDKKQPFAPTPSQLCHPSFTALEPSEIQDILSALYEDQKIAKANAHRLLSLLVTFFFIVWILYVIIIVLPITLRSLERSDLVTILVPVFGGFFMVVISALLPVLLIVGFVFGHTEQRALRQYIDEIETFKNNIETFTATTVTTTNNNPDSLTIKIH
ncbi:DNase I-like protein [Backusella circina FSU 941]|nr:DNase I-like protein [Backusella circina FSU 941]